jgi:hypothetical protein
MPAPRPRSERATLPPEDEALLAAASRELGRAIAAADRCTAEVAKFAADVDSERISMDGVVLEPADDDDSLVVHVLENLRGLSA